MTRRIAAVALAAVLASCMPGASPSPPSATVPPAAAPTAGDLAEFATAVCVDAYERCVEGVLTMAAVASGRLVAICNYEDGSGDVVLVDSEDQAEAECSGDGLISGSRVVRVLELP